MEMDWKASLPGGEPVLEEARPGEGGGDQSVNMTKMKPSEKNVEKLDNGDLFEMAEVGSDSEDTSEDKVSDMDAKKLKGMDAKKLKGIDPDEEWVTETTQNLEVKLKAALETLDQDVVFNNLKNEERDSEVTELDRELFKCSTDFKSTFAKKLDRTMSNASNGLVDSETEESEDEEFNKVEEKEFFNIKRYGRDKDHPDSNGVTIKGKKVELVKVKKGLKEVLVAGWTMKVNEVKAKVKTVQKIKNGSTIVMNIKTTDEDDFKLEGDVNLTIYDKSDDKKGVTLHVNRTKGNDVRLVDIAFREIVKPLVESMIETELKRGAGGEEAKCDPCNKKFTTKHDLKIHEGGVHQAKNKNKTELKKEVVATKEEITEYKSEKVVENVEKDEYRCDECEYVTKRLVQLKRHVTSDHKEKDVEDSEGNESTGMRKRVKKIIRGKEKREMKKLQQSMNKKIELGIRKELSKQMDEKITRKRKAEERNEMEKKKALKEKKEKDDMIKKKRKAYEAKENEKKIKQKEKNLQKIKSKKENEEEVKMEVDVEKENEKEKNYYELNEQVKKLVGKQKVGIQVEGDGLCCPRSVAVKTHGDEIYGTVLRRKMNEHIVDNHEYYKSKGFFTASVEQPFKRETGGNGEEVIFTDEKELKEWLLSSKSLTMWADSEDLLVLANIIGNKIKVVKMDNRDDKSPTLTAIEPCEVFTGIAGAENVEIIIVNYTGTHFDAILDINHPVAREGCLSKQMMAGSLSPVTDEASHADLKKNLVIKETVLENYRREYKEIQNKLREKAEENYLMRIENKKMKQLGEVGSDISKEVMIGEIEAVEAVESDENIEVVQNETQMKRANVKWTDVAKKNTKGKNEVQFNCEKCAFQADRNETLNNHVKRAHGDEPKERTQLTCFDCDKKVYTKWRLMEHRAKAHPSQLECRFYKEKKCNFTKTQCAYKHTDSEDDGSDKVQFTCNYCKKIFECRDDLMKHRKVEHIEKVRPCKKHDEGNCKYTDRECWFKHEMRDDNENNDSDNENENDDENKSNEDFQRSRTALKKKKIQKSQ